MKKFITSKHLLCFLLFPSLLFTLSISGDTLTQGQYITDGKTLISSGGNFALGFFSPTNSKSRYVGIWYNTISVQTVVWVANREKPILTGNGTLTISGNGSLIISDDNSTIYWSTPGVSAGNPIAQLLDTGNFVVREEWNSATEIYEWQSFDYPTDALLPGMKLGWNLTSGLNRYLTGWTSPSDPFPGPYFMGIHTNGDPQVILQTTKSWLWRGGNWDGVRFTGIPEMKTYSAFNFTFVDNEEEMYYMYHILDDSIISRLIVNYDGTTQRLVWLNESSMWNVFWFAPKDPCDKVSPCGPFGVCNPNDSPMCECLQGFDPESPTNWAMRDQSDGCVRLTPLDCRNGTDGFITVSMTKLPDTSNATVNMSMTLDECRTLCLSNCSCTAYASADIAGNETGCIIWTTELTDLRLYTYGGQSLYVRLAAADLIKSQGHKQGVVAVVVSVLLGTLLIIVIGFCILMKKKKKKKRRGTFSFEDLLDKQGGTSRGEELELPLYDLDTVMAATNDFSTENKLGEGGFGPVYKGTLAEGQDIAVKRLSKTSAQGIDEFKNEVLLIAKLQHRNLVRLLGFCIQGDERMLVYEYMPNKSLDAFLFDKVKGASLDWSTRYSIIMGIARGLLYLHEDSRFRIIHRDLKASNILLDKKMTPKISDFGMARIFGGDETEVNTRKVVGTYGYMAPEYAMDGIFSVKSDVFSFGVLVLEIISGQKNRGVYYSESHLNLLGHAWSLWKEENCMELVDESIGQEFPMAEVFRCIKVGLLCVQERPEDRPTMSSVVLMLGSENALLPNPKGRDLLQQEVPLIWTR
ncbi:hypothetical protein J5N97_011790 [Dioscorea zingiberensis]|uniref:Receptor-like serine/threonine-protein kinase n=1 Tax=Dioscorea zingiberensis TaxID=325984 RepID=A0A9D5HNP1_9LILI|nr:hypothetical protein J5N97_011790 [Dioscorea zingiberensis]